jgi:hypothetical protein
VSCIVQTKFVTSPRLDPGRIIRALRCLANPKLLGLTILRYVNLSLASVASCPADCRRSRPASSRDKGLESLLSSHQFQRLATQRRQLRVSLFQRSIQPASHTQRKRYMLYGCDRNCRFHKGAVTVAHWLGLHVLQLLNGKSRSCQSTTCSRRFVSHDFLCGRPVNSTMYFSCSARFTLFSCSWTAHCDI